MKKSTLRSLIWTALAIISFACYGYLGHCTPEAKMTAQMQVELQENLNEKESNIYLPDIALVKKLINITKIVIPND